MTRVVREDAQGIRVIKALSKTKYERERYDRVNRTLVHDEQKAGITMAATNPLMTFFMNVGIAGVILIGGILVNGGLSKPGRILTFMQYFTLISQAMMSVTRIFVMYTKCSASAGRIAEVLECPEDLMLKSSAEFPTRADGSSGYITFEHVNFSYNKTKNNLSDISFRIPRGGSLGIIGATASGKSTIISLLMRLYDIDSGSIRIGGRDVRTIPTDELHSMFGAVMQITQSFAVADISINLAGNPSVNYAGATVVTHLLDYGSTRFDMGYASAIATILFLLMVGTNKMVQKILGRVGE